MQQLTIMAVGDTWIGGEDQLPSGTPALLEKKEQANLCNWLEKVAPVLRQGAFTTGNLEASICSGLQPIEGKAGTGGSISIMPLEAATALKEAGFTAMCVANNHSMDFGAEGLLQTINSLEGAGIAASGGGRNIAEAHEPVIMEHDGVKVGLVSFSSIFIPGIFPAGPNKPGIATVAINTSYQIPGNILYTPGAPPRIITTAKLDDKKRMEEDVKKARHQADIVIVHWHWGLSKYASCHASGLPMEDTLFYVCNYQEDLARAAIDAGADLIIGHHPHRMQGFDMYKGKLICYSLGLLVMPFSMGANLGEESVIVKAYIDRKSKHISQVNLIPLLIPSATMQPYIVPIGEAGRVISEVKRISRKYGTRFEIEGDEISPKAT